MLYPTITVNYLTKYFAWLFLLRCREGFRCTPRELEKTSAITIADLTRPKHCKNRLPLSTLADYPNPRLVTLPRAPAGHPCQPRHRSPALSNLRAFRAFLSLFFFDPLKILRFQRGQFIGTDIRPHLRKRLAHHIDFSVNSDHMIQQ